VGKSDSLFFVIQTPNVLLHGSAYAVLFLRSSEELAPAPAPTQHCWFWFGPAAPAAQRRKASMRVFSVVSLPTME